MPALLVVDDTPIIRSTIINVVESSALGFSSVTEARNGAEAIDCARRLPPDVVLMDIRMPGVDGLEAATVICGECPDVRMVFLTAYDEFAYVQRALKLGAVDYLLKPIRPAILHDVLARLARDVAPKPAAAAPPPIRIAARTHARADPIERAQAYIRQNFRSPSISLAEVAEAAHLSPSHLAHRFRKQVGVGYQQYVTGLRIEAAKTLLDTSDLPISTIAEEVGYPNLTNFYRLFQREVGQTPAACRRALHADRKTV
ncbi:response regulator [Siculibacillus lacustris]|uniref:Response regulator n=1 Tax=Siculibacillus lacustris TaxID=1549641 RepID=A0A4Q9VJ74_9HYPH|nr:response regulator [Siculibacillus lacustris]TBW35343.1 response regulator [Siculibacillus lacustris]